MEDSNVKGMSRTDLDTHANMVVLGRNSTVLHKTGDTAEVQPFTLEYDSPRSVNIIDGAVLYEDQYSLKAYTLVFKNA
eukprot:9236526-Ditylum_brightwellii.AAC.1